MKNNNGLLVVSEDNFITKIIKSLKNFLRIKQDKEEICNRTAVVLTEEKIERRIKRNLSFEDLSKLEEKIINDISYIDNLNEDELNCLDEYYDMRINELECILADVKSKYYKVMSSKRM